MSRKILGYPLQPDYRDENPQVFELPITGARPLSVVLVDGGFTLFVEHDSINEYPKMRKVLVLKAGHEVGEYGGGYSFLGTAVNSTWAWHVYVAKEKRN